MRTIQARLTPQTIHRLGGKVNKKVIREAVRHELADAAAYAASDPGEADDVYVPLLVFSPIDGPFQTVRHQFTLLSGTVVSGGCEIEMRYGPDDRDVMVLTVHPSGQDVVVR